ncbi:receptor-like protein 9DC1 [Rutidosis leptorrhynchoides]|uniref:receptor-like protein 9DC1 n=1 Tax=Rutidosis leptorrhynchoides TaxID=125765 RepID=UPI003A9A55B6
MNSKEYIEQHSEMIADKWFQNHRDEAKSEDVNNLVGRIPQGSQFNTFEGNSFEGNKRLCGLPLPNKCEGSLKPQIKADGSEESGFTWKPAMLEYGCGTPLGIVIGYIMLTTRRIKWFNAIADTGEHMILKSRNKRRYSRNRK